MWFLNIVFKLVETFKESYKWKENMLDFRDHPRNYGIQFLGFSHPLLHLHNASMPWLLWPEVNFQKIKCHYWHLKCLLWATNFSNDVRNPLSWGHHRAVFKTSNMINEIRYWTLVFKHQHLALKCPHLACMKLTPAKDKPLPPLIELHNLWRAPYL